MRRMFGIRVAVTLALVVLASAATAGVSVFQDGHFLLPIYVASDAAPEEREAAAELAHVLEAMSGVAVSVRIEGDAGGNGIFVGRARASALNPPALVSSSDWLAPHPGQVGPDAFRVRAKGGSVYINGATPEALSFAVAWLLQHEAGVRWYVPGPDGEIIPHRREWSLPDLDIIREPAYLSRELSGFESSEGAAWARRNGLRRRLECGHAMSRIFTPQLFPGHPDWFPLLWGHRYCPASITDRDWQPNLALPGVADRASQAAIEAFTREPAEFSFSLGINDTVRFDQGPETQRLVEPIEYFGGMPDYSPLVFTFMNRAAAAVSRAAPDKYLGCLAYFWCECPPSFPVHSHVVPYVAADRGQYYDQRFRADDLDLMTRWGASGVRAFGIWDYAYGSGFVVPRESVGAQAEAVKEGWKRGARGYFGEIGPILGFDAFKCWAMAQLLWNPEIPLAVLEDDFFAGYYGPASIPMRRFFEACQALWMGQAGPPFWLKYYGQEDQALLYPDAACRRLRALLVEAQRLASADSAIAARVDVASRAFAVTEAYVAFDSTRRVLAAFPSERGAFPLEDVTLENAIGSLVRARVALDSAILDESHGKRPMERGMPQSLLRNDPVPRLLFCAGLRDSSAPSRILEAEGKGAATLSSWRAMAEGLASGLRFAPNLTINSNFMEVAAETQEPHFLFPGNGALPAGWIFRAVPTENGRAALAGETGTGDAALHRRSVRIAGAWDSQLFQWIPAKAGSIYLATARVRGRSSPGGDATLFLTFLSRGGDVLAACSQSLPKGDTPDWRIAALCDRAPKQVDWVGVGIGCARQTLGDWMEADSVELRSGMAAQSP